MKLATKTLMATLATTAVLGVSANAATITVTASDTLKLDSVGTGTGIAYTVQNPNSVLLVGIYLDSGDPTPTTVTFGGVAADGFISTGRTTLAYWDNLATGTEQTVQITGSFSSANDALYGLYELAGVDLSAAVTSSTTNTITTATDGEFVVSFAGRNNNGEPSPAGSSIIDSNLIGVNTETSQGGSLSGGTALAGLAGSQNVNWSNADQGILTYSFQAVPEPGSLALLGLGGLLVARRRRNA